MKRRLLLTARLSLVAAIGLCGSSAADGFRLGAAAAAEAARDAPAGDVAQRPEPPPAPPGPELHPRAIRVTVGGHVAIANLIDNATARDFFAMLPLRLTLEDRASTAKAAVLPAKLSTRAAPAGVEPDAGDIVYDVPRGQLAVLYRDAGYASGLVKLGRLEAGAAAFDVRGSLVVTIEAVR